MMGIANGLAGNINLLLLILLVCFNDLLLISNHLLLLLYLELKKKIFLFDVMHLLLQLVYLLRNYILVPPRHRVRVNLIPGAGSKSCRAEVFFGDLVVMWLLGQVLLVLSGLRVTELWLFNTSNGSEVDLVNVRFTHVLYHIDLVL